VEQQATQFLEEKRALREELETVRTAVVDTQQEPKDDTVDNSKEIQEVLHHIRRKRKKRNAKKGGKLSQHFLLFELLYIVLNRI
jgi:hypothetical protein